MQVSIVSRHIAIGPLERAHAEGEAEKLAKFFDGLNEVKITFDREHEHVRVELVCLLSGGATLVALERGRTFDEALEFAADNMLRQVKRYKDKLRDHRVHGTAAPTEP